MVLIRILIKNVILKNDCSYQTDLNSIYHKTDNYEQKAAAVAQSVRAFALQSGDWVFESQPRHIKVVKAGNDISTAKCSKGVYVTDFRRRPL